MRVLFRYRKPRRPPNKPNVAPLGVGGIILVDAPARTPDDDRDTLLGGPGNDLADIVRRNDRLKQIETVLRD